VNTLLAGQAECGLQEKLFGPFGREKWILNRKGWPNEEVHIKNSIVVGKTQNLSIDRLSRGDPVDIFVIISRMLVKLNRVILNGQTHKLDFRNLIKPALSNWRSNSFLHINLREKIV
jgi:hypothetical protein